LKPGENNAPKGGQKARKVARDPEKALMNILRKGPPGPESDTDKTRSDKCQKKVT